MEREGDAGVTKILIPSDVPGPPSCVPRRRTTGDGGRRRTADVGRRTADVGRKVGLAPPPLSGTIPFVPASNFYTVGQVASIAEIAEGDVLRYIKDGTLRANFNQGNMSYLILQDDLLTFLREKRLTPQIQKIMQQRVLVVDRDTNTTFILKNELERSGKIQVKVATSTRDVELSLDANVPDILTTHFGVTQRTQDNLEGVLKRCRMTRPTKLVLYHEAPEQMIPTMPDVQKIVTSLQVDAVVSVSRGMRALVNKIEEILGVDKSHTMVRKPGDAKA
jgi:hypothetical protein